ncbi:MAG: DUF4920 domain-containing protein [Bacteroidetes bacterium]|nr:DUF4920 domain-containing protein [Bacteroidota bacterium]
MKYNLILVVIFFIACNRAEPISDAVYGLVPDVADAIPIEAVVSEPQHYTGANVAVAGTVHEVCQMDGCWLMLRSIDTEDGLRVHAEMDKDGEYQFTVPKDISGRHAIVFGVISIPEEWAEAHYQEDAPGPRPVLSMSAVGVRVSPEESS